MKEVTGVNGCLRIQAPVPKCVSVFLLKVRDAYKTYMKKIAKLLGGGPDSDEQMMKVFEFETKVALVSNDLSMTDMVFKLKR